MRFLFNFIYISFGSMVQKSHGTVRNIADIYEELTSICMDNAEYSASDRFDRFEANLNFKIQKVTGRFCRHRGFNAEGCRMHRMRAVIWLKNHYLHIYNEQMELSRHLSDIDSGIYPAPTLYSREDIVNVYNACVREMNTIDELCNMINAEQWKIDNPRSSISPPVALRRDLDPMLF